MCRGVKHNAAGWASAHFRAVGSIGNLVSNSLLALHFSRSRHVSCTRDVHFPMPSHCCPLHLGRIQVAASKTAPGTNSDYQQLAVAAHLLSGVNVLFANAAALALWFNRRGAPPALR
mmetsp:Transcript_103515/g.200562  ORF Transcript_103515/g.200562 Transcript_103515/m.200562 type:complete len:117 (+) Transcript_103515:1634-1984(+)